MRPSLGRPSLPSYHCIHPLWSSTQTRKSRESLMISHFVPLPSSPGLHSPTPTTLSSFPGLFFTFCSLPSSSPLISSPKKSHLWSNFFHSHHIFSSQFSKKNHFWTIVCMCWNSLCPFTFTTILFTGSQIFWCLSSRSYWLWRLWICVIRL